MVVETNSCASGQKSMPPPSGEPEGGGGYRELVSKALMPALAAAAAAGSLPEGRLAVLYDKNKMEASGYAAALADLAKEPVLLVPFHDSEGSSSSAAAAASSSVEVVAASGEAASAAAFPRGNCAVSTAPSAAAADTASSSFSSVVRFTEDGVLEVRVDGAACAEEVDSDGDGNGSGCNGNNGGLLSPQASSALNSSSTPAAAVWAPVRACLRYVTQRPWNRIPPITRTLIFNPVLACLAGGRNKVKKFFFSRRFFVPSIFSNDFSRSLFIPST